jgi:hypothetical protein
MNNLSPMMGEPVEISSGTCSAKSMTALSSTLSAASSLSGSYGGWSDDNSTGSSYSPTMTSTNAVSASRFKHYHRPTISDSPALVQLCHKYIESGNIDGLARMARNRGLPPALRQYAWPLLLATHPYVVSPCLIEEFPDSSVGPQQELVPSRRIRGDLSRIRTRLNKHQSNNSSNLISTHDSARSTPTRAQSPLNSPIPTDAEVVAAYFSDAVADRRFEMIEDAIDKFLSKWGRTIPYESGMAWVALGLADWVDPVFELAAHSSRQSPKNQSAASTPELMPLGEWQPDAMSFARIYEHLLLVMFHSPAMSADGPSGPCDSPLSQRMSSFLSIFRKLLAETSEHFDEEDVLSNIGGDEWLLWWIKWMGTRVWNKHDRARIWDMYIGWRPTVSLIDESEDDGLGMDPFWNPLELDSNTILDPHTQHLFVCVAILKSKRNTLLELDQSEIRQSLTQVKRANDMESIIMEAGEAWRSWQWAEEHEENDN